MEEWLPLIVGGGGFGVILSAILVYLASQKRNRHLALAERFDDASDLARYIRDEVERQVAPIRAEMQTLKRESHEMNDAVRARETQLWLWDQRGRAGDLPMLPAPILERLGLAHLHPTDHKE
jgi:hypothetical protein